MFIGRATAGDPTLHANERHSVGKIFSLAKKLKGHRRRSDKIFSGKFYNRVRHQRLLDKFYVYLAKK